MFSAIVVGTDGSATATEAVKKAADLAKLCGATVHVVTAYRPITEVVMLPEALPVDLQSLVNPHEDAKSVCDEAVKSLEKGGVKAEGHAVPGHAADALVEVAEKLKADLIIVGNRGMTGKRRLLGSVPNSVSHHAPCSVLIAQTA